MPAIYDTELPQDLLVEISHLVSSLDAAHFINLKRIGPLLSRLSRFVSASKTIDGRFLEVKLSRKH